ncbi:Nitroreductase [Hexamita inflata]|uniref:Nitroreductase n=1 Tax=Hexamita inflata TaxID=28002 RepID=A0ABP1JFV5_9EUKA
MNFKVSDSCVQCNSCINVCPTKSLSLVDGLVTFNSSRCMKCGQCFSICPTASISMFDCNPSTNISLDPLVKAIQMRRSVRSYKSEPLSNEKITEMLQIIRFAPSARNARNTRYIVINRPKLLELIPVIGEILLNIYPHMKAMIQAGGDAIFRGAPHLIVAVESVPQPTDDGVIALAEFELLAQQQGYGTFWCGFFKHAQTAPQVRELVGLNQQDKVTAALGFGIADIQYERPAAREKVAVTFI